MSSTSAQSQPSDVWLRAALLAAAAGMLGRSVHILNGRLVVSDSAEPAYWLTATVILAIGGVLVPLPRVSRRVGAAILSSIVFICVAGNIAQLCQRSIAELPNMRNFLQYSPFTMTLGIFGLSVGVAFAATGILRHIMTAIVLIAFAMLGTLVLQYRPLPRIDVLIFQRDSLAALEQGRDPYAITFEDIYNGKSSWYGPGMSVNGILQFGYPYMPLTLLMAAPVQYLTAGDFRYAGLAACVIAAGLMAYATSDVFSLLGALIFLTTPRIFYVIQSGWTEPFVIVLLAAVVFCAFRFPRAVPYFLGLFLASKQYLPASAVLAFLLIPREGQSHREMFRVYLRMLVKAAVVAALVTLPFVLWNFPAFWKSAVMLQIHQPYRPDSLSFLAWFAGNELISPALGALAFVVLAIAIVFSLWRCRRTPADFTAAVAMCYVFFFAFSKQAFLNYYFFVIGALCCAISAMAPRQPAGSSTISIR
jgi:hypothetical protein